MGYAKDNPLRKVPKFSEKGRAREVYLTQTEARDLVGASDAVMRPFLHAALATGARRGELLRLKWRDVDFDRREVTIHPENEKAGRGRVIPMTLDLLAELRTLRQLRQVKALDGSDAVFLQASGDPITEEVVKKGFDRAIRACDSIPTEKREKVVLHSLRHSCASFMVAAGVPLLDVARILGHSTLAVTMRYAHFAPESGRAAVDKLGKALGLCTPSTEAAAQ
ncbi:MAG: site-specific integrase [Candidatus Brocadiae bacterium]|nr:site-specific integrase [Candidatus Brocadiia bacterium]